MISLLAPRARLYLRQPPNGYYSACSTDGVIAPTTLVVTWSLKVKDIFDCTMKPVGLEMHSGCGVDQLGRNAYPICGFADATFEHVAYA